MTSKFTRRISSSVVYSLCKGMLLLPKFLQGNLEMELTTCVQYLGEYGSKMLVTQLTLLSLTFY
jgi:hypothetical protein